MAEPKTGELIVKLNPFPTSTPYFVNSENITAIEIKLTDGTLEMVKYANDEIIK